MYIVYIVYITSWVKTVPAIQCTAVGVNNSYDEANGAEAGGLRGVGTFLRTHQNLCSFSHFCWQVRTKTMPKTSVKTLLKLSLRMEEAFLTEAFFQARRQMRILVLATFDLISFLVFLVSNSRHKPLKNVPSLRR